MDTLKYPSGSIFFVASWFGLCFLTLTFAVLFYSYLSIPRPVNITSSEFKLYAALPKQNTEQQIQIEKRDGRHLIIADFFKKYQSPLAKFGQNFVSVADQKQLDWRLLPAIAMQESNGGKKIIKDSRNPFGYGIYGQMVLRFPSWEAAIERVGKALREDYLDKGLKNPYQIMAKYTPPSLSKGGDWAKGVNSFMEELH